MFACPPFSVSEPLIQEQQRHRRYKLGGTPVSVAVAQFQGCGAPKVPACDAVAAGEASNRASSLSLFWQLHPVWADFNSNVTLSVVCQFSWARLADGCISISFRYSHASLLSWFVRETWYVH